jgi:hypothetical protein
VVLVAAGDDPGVLRRDDLEKVLLGTRVRAALAAAGSART